MSQADLPPLPDDERNPYAPPRADVEPELLPPMAGDMTRLPFSLGDVLMRSWEIYRDRMGICIGVVIGCWALNAGAQVILSIAEAAAPMARNPREFALAVQVLGTLAVVVFQLWINLGQTAVMLDIARGQEVVFGKVFSGGHYLLRAILAALVFGLLLLGGLALGGIPGGLVWLAVGRDAPAGIVALVLGLVAGFVFAVVLSLRLSQFLYLIIDRDAGVIEALRASSQITRGKAGMVFVIFLLTSAINAGGLLACFIGLIITVPFTVLLLVVTYLALTGQSAADPYAKGEPYADLEPL